MNQQLKRLPTLLRARAVTANDREGVRDARRAFQIAAEDVEHALESVSEETITERQLRDALNILGIDNQLDWPDWNLAQHIISTARRGGDDDD